MSSITLRGVSGFGTPTNQTTLSVTFPTNLQPGDFMFVWCCTNASSSYSWTEGTGTFSAAPLTFTTSAATAQLLWKTATVSDAATAASSGTYTITLHGSATPWVVVAGAYGGVNPDLPFDVLPTTSGLANIGTTLTTNGVKTFAYNEQLLWFGASGSTATLPTISAPAGFAAQISQVNTATGSGTQMCALFADETNVTPAGIGSQNGTLSTSHGYAGLLLALVPKSPMQTFDFESGMQSWTIYPGTATAAQSTDWSRSGTHSAKVTTNGSTANPLLIRTFQVIPLTTYYLAAWCYSPLGWSGGTNGLSLGFDCYADSQGTAYLGGLVTPPAPFAAGTVRSLPPLKFTMPKGCYFVHTYVRWNGTPSAADSMYVDDIMFGPWPGNTGRLNRQLLP